MPHRELQLRLICLRPHGPLDEDGGDDDGDPNGPTDDDYDGDDYRMMTAAAAITGAPLSETVVGFYILCTCCFSGISFCVGGRNKKSTRESADDLTV